MPGRVRGLRVLLLLLLALAGTPGRAWAHASLLGSEPADGAVLPASPAQVALRFDEEVELIRLVLVGPGGAQIPSVRPPAVHGGTLHAEYPAGLPAGTYLLSYRITSEDGHPVTGTILFGVGQAPSAPAGAGAALGRSGDGWGAARWTTAGQVARFLFYAALAAAAGGALFRCLVADVPASLRRVLRAAALGGVLLAVFQVWLRGALLEDLPGSADLPAVASAWARGLAVLGWSLGVSAAGLLGCAAALAGRGRAARVLGGAAGVLTVAGLPLTGHAATADPRWLTASVLFLHALAATFWLGAFLPLRLLLQGPAWAAAAAVRRFSAWAVPAVALLAAAGGVLAFVQTGGSAAALGTAYGALLCAKAVGLAALVIVAARNRNRLTPRLLAGSPGAAIGLRRSIGAELVLAGAVLATTSVLTLTPPPRASGHDHPAVAHHPAEEGHAGHVPGGRHAAEGAAEGIAAVSSAADGLTAHIQVTPGRAGGNRILVALDRAGAPVPAPKEAWIELSHAAAGVAPVRRKLLPDGAGQLVHAGPELAIPGRWTLRIELLLTDWDTAVLPAEVVMP